MKHHLTRPDGTTVTWDTPDQPRPALDANGVMATLNAVLGLWPLEDAARTVGLTPDDLVAEAEAWWAAVNLDPVDEVVDEFVEAVEDGD